MSLVATVPLALADLDEAVDAWDAQRAEAHRQGSVFRIAGVQLWNGYTQYLRGELAEAESELRALAGDVEALGHADGVRARACTFLAEVLVERGAVDEARVLFDAAGSARVGSDQAILLDRARMRVLLAAGRPEEALAYADVYELHAGWKRHPRYVPWRSLKAQALERLGRQVEAVALAEDELEIARGWGSAGHRGRSLRVLGTILRADGIEQLEEACALLEQAPARLEHAKALAALGATLRRARKPTEAREPLRRALELADMCGAQPLADAVRAEIYATGARPRTTALRGVWRIDRERAPGRRSCGRWADEPRHRADPVRDAQDGRGASQQRVPQAGHRLAARARARPRRVILTRLDSLTASEPRTPGLSRRLR